MSDRKNLALNLEKHLELEKKSIERGEQLLNYRWLTNRKGLSAMIENWREDEKRHHKFLKELAEKPFIPINPDDFVAIFRNDEEYLEGRYLQSKKYQQKHE